MVTTTVTRNESNLSELYELRYEVFEACENKSSFMVNEQVIRFENILRYYLEQFDLDGRYIQAVKEMKLLIFRQIEYGHVQKRLLEELRRLTMDVNYLSY